MQKKTSRKRHPNVGVVGGIEKRCRSTKEKSGPVLHGAVGPVVRQPMPVERYVGYFSKKGGRGLGEVGCQ